MIRFENMHPFRELEEIGERFNRLFGRLPVRRDSGQEALTVADWVPRVDITKDDREYLIKAEIPEVDKKDVRVTVQDCFLTIQAERKQKKEENNDRVHRIERFYGTFVRSFSLPEEVEEDNPKAEFEGWHVVGSPTQGREAAAKRRSRSRCSKTRIIGDG